MSETNSRLNWELEMLKKIDSGEKLAGHDLSELFFENMVDFSHDDDDEFRSGTAVVELGGRFFEFAYGQSLGKHGDHFFEDQPYEVEKKEYEKTVQVVEWVKKEKATA